MRFKQKLSILLTICMLVGLVPWSAVPVLADSDEPTNTVEVNEASDFGTLEDGCYTLASDTLYRLMADVTLEGCLYFNDSDESVVLDLNGHVLDRGLGGKEAQSDGCVIYLSGSDATLTLRDSAPNARHLDGSRQPTVGYTDPVSGEFVEVTGGVITGGNSDYSGGGVYCNDSISLRMEGGTIVGNSARYNGGGVHFSYYNCSLTMSGSSAISGNSAGSYGGGVYFEYDHCSLTMSGDSAICGNSAGSYGGGVYAAGRSDVTMREQSAISDNKAQDGGGVYTVNGASFDMSGGTLSDNCATNGVGGVYVNGYGLSSGSLITGGFSMSGGEISGNRGTSCGGVYIGGYSAEWNRGSYGDPIWCHETNTLPCYISGGAVIADNFVGTWSNDAFTQSAPCNLYLSEVTGDGDVDGETVTVTVAATVTVTDTLSKNASIGVTTQRVPGEEPVVFAQGRSRTLTDADLAHFTSDRVGFSPALNGDGKLELRKDTAWQALQKQFDAASTDPENPTKITLTMDVVAGENDGPLTLTGGRYVTLDLAGFTIDRGLSNADKYVSQGWVMQVGTMDYYTGAVTPGYLTLTDSSGGGKITGGKNFDDGGGVIIDEGATFTMTGGAVCGNAARSDGGGVVNFGTFTMTGGAVRGNTAGSYGGGVCNYGTFELSGGTITGNTTGETAFGGGVYVYDSEFRVSGSPVVTGNTRDGEPSNVFLNGAVAELTGPLGDGAQLGIGADSERGARIPFTSGWNTYMSNADFADFFTSDDPMCTIEKNAETGELDIVFSPWKALQDSLYVAGVDLARDEDHAVSTETDGVTGGTAALTLDKDGNPILTLTDFVYAGEGSAVDGGFMESAKGLRSGSFAAISYRGDLPLTVVLSGESSVTQVSESTPETSYGFYASIYSGDFYQSVRGEVDKGEDEAGLTFTGDGSLTIFGGTAGYASYGLHCTLLTVDGAAVQAFGGKANYSYGVYCDDLSLVSGGSLFGVGGDLAGDGGQCSYGVNGYGEFSVGSGATLFGIGGSVESTSEDGYAVSMGVSCSGLTIDGGTVKAIGGAASGYSENADCESLGLGIKYGGGNEMSGYHTGSMVGTVTVRNGGKLTASGETRAIEGSVVNDVAGMGCASADGAGEWTGIPVSAEGQELDYKLVHIPTAFSVRDGKVTAPAGAVLLCAEYDASGRLLSVKSAAIPAGCFGADAAGLLGIDGLPTVCKLMLVDGKTYAPLCEAWSRDARK